MIQIIKGTFGYYNGRKVIPITEADGPQKLSLIHISEPTRRS